MLRILWFLGLGGLLGSCGARVNSSLSALSLINSKVTIVPLVGDSNADFAAIVTGSDDKKLGYRINCGSNINQAGNAFGFIDANAAAMFSDAVEAGTALYDELKLDSQPTFNCQDNSDKPQVFALYGEDAAADPLTTHYAKFPSRPHELYALACQNQLDFFGVKTKDLVRITAGSLANLVPAAELQKSEEKGVPPKPVIKPLSCYSDEGFARTLLIPSAPPSVRMPAIKNKQSQVWKVANTGDWPGIPSTTQAFPYVVSAGGMGFAVGCGINSPSLFTALGIKTQLRELQFIDPVLLEASQPRQQPVLRCDSSAAKPAISKIFRVLNDSNPNKSVYVQFEGNETSLVRLGCSKLQQHFGSENRTPIDVTEESLKYLTFQNNSSSQSLVDLSCAGPDTGSMIESKLTEQASDESRLYLDICKDPAIRNQAEWCRAQLYTKVDAGKPNQRFQMDRRDGDFVVLKENQEGQCLAVDNNGYVVTQACANGWWTQEWELSRVGQSDFHTLRNRHTNRCLDVPGALAEQGKKLILHDCHRGLNQQWRFVPE